MAAMTAMDAVQRHKGRAIAQAAPGGVPSSKRQAALRQAGGQAFGSRRDVKAPNQAVQGAECSAVSCGLTRPHAVTCGQGRQAARLPEQVLSHHPHARGPSPSLPCPAWAASLAATAATAK